MLIVCPKCLTKYLVSDEITGVKVQKCHCSACGFYFEQKMQDAPLKEGQSSILKAETKTISANLPDKDETNHPNQEIEVTKIMEDDIVPSLFLEPLNSDEKKEKKQTPVVPEEFKPVESKKSSFIGTLFWLSVGAGICFFAYLQKDYFLDKIDTLVIEQLDKSKKNDLVMPKIKPSVLEQGATVYAPIKSAYNGIDEPINQPTVSVSVEAEKELTDEKVDYAAALNIQNVSYELGVNEVGMNRLLIKGAVLNTTLRTLKLPETKAVIYDNEDNIVARKRITFTEKDIQGNSEVLFETAVVPAPKSVSKIEVVFDE